MFKHVTCNNVVTSMYEPGKLYNLVAYLLQPCNYLKTILIQKLLQGCGQVVTSMCCLLVTILSQCSCKQLDKVVAILKFLYGKEKT